MNEVVEVSYTGDLLSHRRCSRAWAYEKHVGFRPYELVQAMEGLLIHHAMEWLTSQYHQVNGGARHAEFAELRDQLHHHFRVLWARGIRTAFETKEATINRVLGNLYPGGVMDPVVKTVLEGAVHAEYPIRAVRQILPADYAGKSKLLLTGVVDLVIQHQAPLRYDWVWEWESLADLDRGQRHERPVQANTGDEEIWDYKGTRATNLYVPDYVRQVLTYAALYRERVDRYPARCVLYFVNEPDKSQRLLAIDVNEAVVEAALAWTHSQVRELLATVRQFERDPLSVEGGDLESRGNPPAERISTELKKQCTACGLRFDCQAYGAHLRAAGGGNIRDIDIYDVRKN